MSDDRGGHRRGGHREQDDRQHRHRRSDERHNHHQRNDDRPGDQHGSRAGTGGGDRRADVKAFAEQARAKFSDTELQALVQLLQWEIQHAGIGGDDGEEDKKKPTSGGQGSTPPPPVAGGSIEKKTPRIAFDCGNVICCSDTDTGAGGERQGLVKSIVEAKCSPECIASVKRTVELFGADNVFVLSKCGTRTQQATVIFLGLNDFFEQTGVLPHNVLFCEDRSGGVPPSSEEEMLQLQPPRNEGEFKGLVWKHFQFAPGSGPRVAPRKMGKGALATTFQLTTLVDDKQECLMSFNDEGILHKDPTAGLLLQALWQVKNATLDAKRYGKTPSNYSQCATWAEALRALEGLHARRPVVESLSTQLNRTNYPTLSVGQQKNVLGERLHTYIFNMSLDTKIEGRCQVAKITGMLLERDNAEILNLLDAPAQLNKKVSEALELLQLSHDERSR